MIMERRGTGRVFHDDGPGVSADELRGYLAGRVHTYWVPDAFEFVEAIPRTSTGKTDREALRRELSSREAPTTGATRVESR